MPIFPHDDPRHIMRVKWRYSDRLLDIRRHVAGLPEDVLEHLGFTNEMADLRDAYLDVNVVSRR